MKTFFTSVRFLRTQRIHTGFSLERFEIENRKHNEMEKRHKTPSFVSLLLIYTVSVWRLQHRSLLHHSTHSFCVLNPLLFLRRNRRDKMLRLNSLFFLLFVLFFLKPC